MFHNRKELITYNNTTESNLLNKKFNFLDKRLMYKIH